MRPQHITAENVSLVSLPPCRAARTSMRPQHITAENGDDLFGRDSHRDTSMRPQHITAENAGGARAASRGNADFNEAAAYHCGKRTADRQVQAGAILLQ